MSFFEASFYFPELRSFLAFGAFFPELKSSFRVEFFVYWRCFFMDAVGLQVVVFLDFSVVSFSDLVMVQPLVRKVPSFSFKRTRAPPSKD